MTDDYRDGIAFIDGDYVPIGEARIPLLDWGFLRSDANQDTVTVWNGILFRLDDHLERFERNYKKLRMVSPYSGAEIREIAIDCVRRTGLREAYVQMIMTRGRPPVGCRDLRRCENKFHMFCIPYVWIATPEAKRRGLILHVSDRRRIPPESVDPTIKHYHWLEFEMGLFDAYDAGADTVVLVDHERNLTEGPGFNIFVVNGETLLTPERGVLDGMTRRTVFELCEELGLTYGQTSIPRYRLAAAAEVFLTSSAGGIIPITRVDGHKVGNGAPGPITLKLDALYWSKREAGWYGTAVEYDAVT